MTATALGAVVGVVLSKGWWAAIVALLVLPVTIMAWDWLTPRLKRLRLPFGMRTPKVVSVSLNATIALTSSVPATLSPAPLPARQTPTPPIPRWCRVLWRFVFGPPEQP
jgi:hypothetical protein